MAPSQQPDNSRDRNPSPTSDEGIADIDVVFEESESDNAEIEEAEVAGVVCASSLSADFFIGKYLVVSETEMGDPIFLVMSGEESGPSPADDSGSELNDPEPSDVPEAILIEINEHNSLDVAESILIEINEHNSLDVAEVSLESADSTSGDLKKT
ncbi:hypothetical protein TNCV_1299541 [Trichonephila clavipes]|nr:hypothetical protein TNCV_1299541 [Trichonephila clavipes]